MKDVFPNFLIAGAAKCGTTSLYGYLSQHPDVFMPDKKELYYFSRPWDGDWVPQNREEYLSLFAGGAGKKAVGEASSDYSFHEKAPERIWRMLGDRVRIIICLRNPVDMMFSMWEHSCRERWDARPLREALLGSRLDDPMDEEAWHAHWCTLYLARAQYDAHLQRYLALFPRENIKVFLFEEFFRPGLPLWGELCNFLDIDPGFEPDARRQNEGVGVRLRGVVNFFHHYYPQYVFPVLQHVVPHPVRKRAKAFILRTTRRWENRGAVAVRTELEQRLDGSVRRLEALLGRDLSDVWF